jgi:hypothetical protein
MAHQSGAKYSSQFHDGFLRLQHLLFLLLIWLLSRRLFIDGVREIGLGLTQDDRIISRAAGLSTGNSSLSNPFSPPPAQ